MIAPAVETSLTIQLNGESRTARQGMTVAALLAELGLDPRLVVVECNREILRDRDSLPSVLLQSGDVIEIVHFVGGG